MSSSLTTLVPILSGPNYQIWSTAIKSFLMLQGQWHVLSRPCPRDITVIVMTFWYVFGTDLTFFELFKLYFHLGLIMTPHVFYDLCLFPFSYVLSFTRSHGQEKSLSYYDLFNFGVLLIYGCISTLISFFLLLHHLTPILTIKILVIRADLKKNV